jgi:hypothetical protein
VTIGSSGGRSDGRKKDGSIHHYAVVDVSAKDVNIKPITIDGDTMNINWVVDSSKVDYKNIMYNLAINPIEISWQDSTLNDGVFNFHFKNKLQHDITLNMEWQTNETYTDKQYQFSSSTGSMFVKKDSAGSLSFRFKSLSGQILTGPLAKITALYKNDTLTFKKRPLIRKNIGVDKLHKHIIIDGELTDDVWQKSINRVQNTFGGLNRNVDYDSTWIGLSYDDKYLYVAFKCYEPHPDSIRKPNSTLERDMVVPEDLIEFLIYTEKDTSDFKILALSPSGSIIDAVSLFINKEKDYSWNGVGSSKVITKKDSWQGEFNVSWKSLGLKQPTPFYVNCIRPSARFAKRKGNVCLQLPLDVLYTSDAKAVILK